jgi:hypothetical protein
MEMNGEQLITVIQATIHLQELGQIMSVIILHIVGCTLSTLA